MTVMELKLKKKKRWTCLLNVIAHRIKQIKMQNILPVPEKRKKNNS